MLLQKTVSKLIGLGAPPVDLPLLLSHWAASSLAGVIPFMVGGSNDQSYSNASGLLDHHTDNVRSPAPDSMSDPFDWHALQVFVVNIDAHLDVRPLKEGPTFPVCSLVDSIAVSCWQAKRIPVPHFASCSRISASSRAKVRPCMKA